MKKEHEKLITKTLGVEPILIDSARVTAQSRKRLYWTNISNITQPDFDKDAILSKVIESGYVDREKAYCIDANYSKGGNLKSYFEKKRRQIVFDNSEKGYRLLTPIECERLQGVPDNYTSGVSNTQRYKMIGNSFTAPIIAHILSFMEK